MDKTPNASLICALVIGGMNMDILGTGSAPFLEGDSIPGRIEMRPGGVGYNIACRLAKAGVRTELLTLLGDDFNADMLRDACAIEGIGLSLSKRTSGPSPIYLAIHDRQGEMRAAVNDTKALEALDPFDLRKALSGANHFNACVLDANLSVACLQSAAASVNAPMIADPVSAVKCQRLLPVMGSLTAIKPNRMEAQAMTGENSPERAAEALIRLGVKQVFISLGAEGVFYSDRDHSGFHRGSRLAGVSVTGAGDAMAAGITLGVALGLPVDETALIGMRYSQDFLKSSTERPKTEEDI